MRGNWPAESDGFAPLGGIRFSIAPFPPGETVWSGGLECIQNKNTQGKDGCVAQIQDPYSAE